MKSKDDLPPHKRYKKLGDVEKVKCLFTDDDIKTIKKDYDKMKIMSRGDSPFANNKLFMNVLTRICRVLQYNYLDDFCKKQVQEVVFVHRRTLPVLGFNSLGKDFIDSRVANKAGTGQSNIFLQFAELKDKT